jgi:DNA repair ATPase RecN
MNFQIIRIVLYSHDGIKKNIKLEHGLNIITGDSKTGKTALIDIIDYCLGSGKCNIPIGPIRNKVNWVAVHIQITKGEIFIARKIPNLGTDYCSEIYYSVGNKIEIPELSKLIKNVNLVALKQLLSKHININENEAKNGLKANIRHSLYYTFQKQDEIMGKGLFHKQNDEPYIKNHIKDTFPYFLGAVEENSIAENERLRYLKRKLKGLELRLNEKESIKGEGLNCARELMLEAIELGLSNAQIMPEDMEDYIISLKEIRSTDVKIEEVEYDNSAFKQLQNEREILLDKIHGIKHQINAVKELDMDSQSYSKEIGIQLDCLKSIELFDKNDVDLQTCPVCNSNISNRQLPQLTDFEKSINKLKTQIRGVDERSPQMQETIRLLNAQLEEVKLKFRENKEELNKIQESNVQLTKYKDYNEKIAYLKGKIDLYLNNLSSLKEGNLSKEIEKTKKEIQKLESELNDKNSNKRIDFILRKLSIDMTNWAQQLELEHSENPVFIDKNQLTVIFKTQQGNVRLRNIGSGENWVGYHLITHFALHKWFVNKNRPIPRFLFIDQPSQIAFPPDKEIDDNLENESNDTITVKRMFKLAYNLTQELSPKFQIIATDHADFKDDWFQNCVIQRWRGGEKLVPKDWPDITE